MQDALFGEQGAPRAAGALVVAATDGSARPNPGRAAGAWFVDDSCWQAVAVEGTSTNNVGGLAGVYRTPHIHARIRGVHTHTVPVDAYRGAGRPRRATCSSAWSTKRRA